MSDFWRTKLELDVIAECSVGALTLDGLYATFCDEEGDSTTSRAELAEIAAALVERGMLQAVQSGGATAWLATDEGFALLDSFPQPND